MQIVLIPDAILAKFNNVKETIELCSMDGRVLGFFTPEQSDRRHNLDPGISDEEMMRRVAEGGGCTLEEIFAKLETGKYD